VNRVTTLFQGPSVVVERFDHAEHCFHRDEGPEVTRSIAVTFVERGDFEIVEAKEPWRFSQLDVLLSVPGTPRTYRHHLECPTDVCLSLSYAPELVEEAFGRLPRLLPPRVPAGVASGFALRRVLQALKSSDAMAIESVAFDCTVAIGPHSWEGTGKLKGASAHARRIASACEAMADGLAADHSLASTARAVGMSTFYFARVFRELVGLSPHQYLLRARLAHAARLLRQEASVTEAALSSGFGNLSHFTRTFHRHFGVAPVQYAKRRTS
jgi:AraC family transcriptional regulator